VGLLCKIRLREITLKNKFVFLLERCVQKAAQWQDQHNGPQAPSHERSRMVLR